MRKVFYVFCAFNLSGKDDLALTNELKSFYHFYHLLVSTWLNYTVESAIGLWNKFSPHFGKEERILILEIS